MELFLPSSHQIQKLHKQKCPIWSNNFPMVFRNRKWIYFSLIRSKSFSNKFVHSWSYDSKLVFRNIKWNYQNRKWNYFSTFQSSDLKISLWLKWNWVQWFQKQGMELSKQEMELSTTGNGSISSLCRHQIKKLL